MQQKQLPVSRSLLSTSEDLVVWMDPDGLERTQVASEDLKSEPFHQALPARFPHQYRQRRHYEGLYWFSSTEEHVWHESLFEATALMCWDFTGHVVGIAPQPMKIVFASGLQHYPDFFALLSTGEQVLYDVRPSRLVSAETRAQFDATAKVCHTIGWGYEVFTDIDPVQKANLEWLGAYRHRRYSPAPDIRQRLLGQLKTPQSIRSAASGLNPEEPFKALPSIYHLMWAKLIGFDAGKSLSTASQVWAWAR